MICYSNLSVLDTTHCHQGLAVSSTFPLMVLSSKFLGMAPHAMFPWFDMKARGKTLFPALLYPPTIPEQGLIDVDRPGLGGGACSWTNHHSQENSALIGQLTPCDAPWKWGGFIASKHTGWEWKIKAYLPQKGHLCWAQKSHNFSVI